jgi:hypothetical protein
MAAPILNRQHYGLALFSRGRILGQLLGALDLLRRRCDRRLGSLGSRVSGRSCCRIGIGRTLLG